MTRTSLHIALITETFAPQVNGVAHTLSRLSDGLRGLGHRVEVVRPRQVEEREEPGRDLLLCRGWPLPGYPQLQWGQSSMHKLLRRWRRDRPDVLYIATEGPLGFSALRAARRLKITVVSGFHTNFQQYSTLYGLSLLTRWVTHYLRWFHNRTRMTLVPSGSQRVLLQGRGFERLEMLARGVDSQLFNPARRSHELRRQWGLQDGDLALLYVGRLAAEKNLGLLPRTLAAVHARYPGRRLRLLVVGDGPQRSWLQQQLPDALFCGTLRDEALATHYASADVFVFPSLTETFGNVVLEAQASGLGVVAYDSAAAAQHIRHGHTGAVALPGDEEDFIEAVNWLLEDDEALRRVRLNARHHATRQGWAAIVKRFESHLRSACQANGAAQWPVTPGSSEPHG
ncbi:glycosyltransferase family 1 protein [Pseudomonas sp. HR96]|uniref:glycosyltransferase family 4 protein n=1 Tax=Pseudomonas sp. HR96 TaxID=1027966 RepID=UPI002A758719|nr:glycosyltransferase family 1 protein [Pseudomonas sp. HR96]WPP00704.1 glycosyltransferase family 1 protein [Pseudomonas sp. HR96]